MVGSIMVGGVLTHCMLSEAMHNLKGSQMNMNHNLIQVLMPYEFKLSYNAVEGTKIFCVNGDGTVVYSTRWFKKFCSGCKNHNDQARSDRPKIRL